MEDLKQPVENIQENLRKLAETQVSYVKLWIFKVTMKTIMRVTQFILVFFFLAMTVFFLSIGLAFYLGEVLESQVSGFLIVGALYAVMIPAVAMFAVPKLLKKPMLRTFSNIYLDE